MFLQMPLVVFKRERDVGVLEDIEHPIIRENVEACELVVGRLDVMWRKRSAVPLPAYNTPLGLSKASLGAFQVAQIMNFFPCILPPVPYWRLGSGRVRPSPASKTSLAKPIWFDGLKHERSHARGGECAEASAPFGCGTLIGGTPFGGRFALPRAERAVERIRILVTDEKCRFSDFDRRIAEVLSDQFMAGFVEKLPEGGSFVGNAAL
jgi:hypothetical protein